MVKKNGKPKTIMLSLISTFAVLNIVADVFPFTPVLGAPGAYFRLGWILAPLTGILLGPVAGGSSCIIASLIELFLGFQTWNFGVFSPFRSGLSAFQSGLLVEGKWKTAITTLGLLIFSWILLPTGQEALIILPFHLVGLILIVLFRSSIAKYVSSSVWRKMIVGIAIATYCGNISRHLFGNIILILLANLPSIYFISAIPFTLVEQVTFTISSAIIGTALNKTRLSEFLQKSR